MHPIARYVPHTHLEQVKLALFNVDSGAMNGSDRGSWQTTGQGQFHPLNNSEPTTENKLSLTHIEKHKIEIVYHDQYIEAATRALLEPHPYDTPAYFIHTMTHIPS